MGIHRPFKSFTCFETQIMSFSPQLLPFLPQLSPPRNAIATALPLAAQLTATPG
jgi:hypothetical protein